MNIVIVGGGREIDFLIRSLLEKKHKITIINENERDCRQLAHEHAVQVVLGDGSKPYVLEDAGIGKADLMIALTPKDADNLVICQLAKKEFHVRRAFATVTNPKNVAVFKKLGINTAISATHVMASIIEQMASVEEIVSYMPVEDGKLQFIEVFISAEHKVCGKKLMNLHFPKNAIIGCIIRCGKVIVPNGRDEIQDGDKLIVLSSNEAKKDALAALAGSV